MQHTCVGSRPNSSRCLSCVAPSRIPKKANIHHMFHRTLLDVLDPRPSFCSTPLPTQTSLPSTGSEMNPSATPRGGMLGEQSPLTGYVPKTCSSQSVRRFATSAAAPKPGGTGDSESFDCPFPSCEHSSLPRAMPCNAGPRQSCVSDSWRGCGARCWREASVSAL